MTPKDKALELYGNINAYIPIEANISDSIEVANRKMIIDNFATKNICLFLVDEIIKTQKEFGINQFWQEVKQEITKL